MYVLRSQKDGDFYVGCTNNFERRFKEHNNGRSYSTKHRAPFKTVYVEIYLNQQDAFAREKFLKTGWGKNYLKRVLKNYLSELFQKLGG